MFLRLMVPEHRLSSEVFPMLSLLNISIRLLSLCSYMEVFSDIIVISEL